MPFVNVLSRQGFLIGFFGQLSFIAVVLLVSRLAVAQMPAPMCGIPVIAIPGHPMGGQATFGPMGEPVILIDPNIEGFAGSGFVRFTLAHECAHHLLGHLHRLRQISMYGPYVLLAVNPSIELEADCWAAEQLARIGDTRAIVATANFFLRSQGPFSSPGYPTGQTRAANIARCGGLR